MNDLVKRLREAAEADRRVQHYHISPELAEEAADALSQREGVVVPREPTTAMEDAALHESAYQFGHGITRAAATAIYRAMIAAASERIEELETKLKQYE